MQTDRRNSLAPDGQLTVRGAAQGARGRVIEGHRRSRAGLPPAGCRAVGLGGGRVSG